MFIPAFSYFDIGTDMIYLNGSLVLGWDSDRKTAIPAHMNVFISCMNGLVATSREIGYF